MNNCLTILLLKIIVVALISTAVFGDNPDKIIKKSGMYDGKFAKNHPIFCGGLDKNCKSSTIRRIHMKPEHQTYKGHNIEVRVSHVDKMLSFGVQNESEPKLLIDNKSVGYGQLPDGKYFLKEYAYDWHDDLMGLGRALVDYREKSEKIKSSGEK